MSEVADLIKEGREIEAAVRSTDWTVKHHAGAGFEIRGVLPAGFNFRGKDYPADGTTRVMLYALSTPATVCVGYERWVQFSTEEWDAMQAANARRIEFACNNQAKYLRMIEIAAQGLLILAQKGGANGEQLLGVLAEMNAAAKGEKR